ncbi:MAG: zinc-dependent metalloprotease [Oscillatoriaceae bacterium SKW80]|nr:zinc-dependent metalloprotease [Oscillatoriaceae bacterium SKYG93]MCX8121083.1 zinc-dependent metalloprotease [Oscillatoriaceae bacterium SKW80]MDW8453587.1 zinc-dependent metalloprotease [Oscillatoriaceae cyanobacterium SKYGB_i_bin93]HIK26938.1 zinc-dependent metalloprotease [Oscillatoriaceae cyanobacterium M7585_C2015_266]
MRKISLYLCILQGIFLGIYPTLLSQVVATPANKAREEASANKQETIKSESEAQDIEEFLKDAEKLEGIFTLYRHKKTGKIYLELKPEQLNKNYLATITLESGIGEQFLYSGLPLQDFIFYFQKINNTLQFVLRNVNYRTNPGDPQERSVNRSFSDSVLYSLEIKNKNSEKNTIIIDLGDLFLQDVPNLASLLKSTGSVYEIDESKTYFGNVKVFPENIEIESIYGFKNELEGKWKQLQTLPDRRAFNLKIHYSLSELPKNNGYIPRLADERVGYFTTNYRNFSNISGKDPMVRYINRWHLEKQDVNAPLSPPKKPIIFWIENTVPLEYRDAIREGVLMWNKAFEKAGFLNALEVRQMPDNADWDPADVRYNTIRWLTSVDGAFAIGPSRVNPLTGEILDADILVDANMVRAAKQEYRSLIQLKQSGRKSFISNLIKNSNLCGFPHAFDNQSQPQTKQLLTSLIEKYDLCFSMEIAHQAAVGSMALLLLHNVMPSGEEMKEYTRQFIRYLIAHEVGHTLGLRHNFRGSTMLKPEELNKTEITRTRGLVSSIMDYVPVNLAPIGEKQGDYFPQVVGPYDIWAIAYGYQPSGANTPEQEKTFLEAIASQQANNPELAYSPDEDSFDLDPTANYFDMSSDPLRYAQWQMDNARILWERLNKLYPTAVETYSEVSEMFNTIFGQYLHNAYVLTKYIGGQSFYRDRPGSGSGRLPFEPVPIAKQREALAALQKYIFAEDAFNFPPELLNKLAPSPWVDLNANIFFDRLDFPIHDIVFISQVIILQKLLSGERMERLRDIEIKSPPEQALTLPELFNTLLAGIWTEVLKPRDGVPNISSFRRSLQREHLNILINMVLRRNSVPEDGRALAWEQLRQLGEKIERCLRRQGRDMNDYTKAHLEEIQSRIVKALDAPLQSR